MEGIEMKAKIGVVGAGTYGSVLILSLIHI